MSSLLEQASIIITPNGVKAGKLYGLKPKFEVDLLTPFALDVVRATTATRGISAGLIETVTNNVPRLDYTNRSCPSILVEPQRTNLLTNSDGNISTYPTRGGNIVQSLLPINGFSNSVEFQNNLTTSFLYKNFITLLSTNYVLSVFVQMNDNSIPVVGLNVNSSDFSLIISGEFATNLKTERLGNTNVFRVSGFFNSINVVPNFGVIKLTNQSSKGFRVTGYQLEPGSYPTSYIPTVASAVTRNADVISKTGIADLIGQTEGVLFVETKSNENIFSQGFAFLNLSDTTSGNWIFVGYDGDRIRGFVRANSTTIFSNQDTPISPINKIALAYKSGQIALFINGNLIATSASGFTLNSLTTLGTIVDGVNNVNNRLFLESVIVYKTRLTNAQLATLTTL